MSRSIRAGSKNTATDSYAEVTSITPGMSAPSRSSTTESARANNCSRSEDSSVKSTVRAESPSGEIFINYDLSRHSERSREVPHQFLYMQRAVRARGASCHSERSRGISDYC